VYFFFNGVDMPPGMWLKVPSVSILVDGTVVAKLRQREFVGVRVPAGRRAFASQTFGTKPKDSSIEFDVAAGEQVFLRVDMWVAKFGLVKWAAYLRLVEPREGVLMVSTLRAVAKKDIRDAHRVTTEPPAAPPPVEPAGTAEPWMIPDEQGVYVVRQRILDRLSVELANAIERAVGLTATLKQARSPTRVELPAEFVIRSREGTAAAEYVLLQLFTRENRREFRILAASSFHVQGPERVAVPFEPRRIAPATFHLKLVAAPRGEYAFVRPGTALTQNAASDAVTFTFGVDGFAAGR
jgi:hypothetical protein